jgi:hypothetical protein
MFLISKHLINAPKAPLDEVDRAFLSQFISMMRRDGMKVVKHGRHNINKRTIRINNKVTHITWNSKRTQLSKNVTPAVIALQDVTEVSRGAFPGSVALPMGMVKVNRLNHIDMFKYFCRSLTFKMSYLLTLMFYVAWCFFFFSFSQTRRVFI